MPYDIVRAPARRPGAALLLVVLLALALTACSSSDGVPTAGGSPQPPSTHSAHRYVALGDSYSAAPLVPVTDVANGCFRSSNNYPTLVAKALGTAVDDRTCGSATTANMTRAQHPDVPPQLDAVTPSTRLVTVGIGGNDEGVFSTLVFRCPTLRAGDPHGAPCQRSMERGGKDVLLTALGRTTGRIASVLAEVHRRAPRAKVLAVGYPQLVDAASQCPELPLAAGDYAYAEKVNRALSEAVRRAAETTGSTYVDVWKASSGHDICSEDPWVNGSVDDEKTAARYHPFAAEQQAVAKLVVEAARP